VSGALSARRQRPLSRCASSSVLSCTDLRGFSTFIGATPVVIVEKSLTWLLDLVEQACLEFGGTNRFNAALQEGTCDETS